PVVVVGRKVIGVDIVSVYDRVGAKLAVQHLVDLGHRDIAHIDGGPNPGSRAVAAVTTRRCARTVLPSTSESPAVTTRNPAVSPLPRRCWRERPNRRPSSHPTTSPPSAYSPPPRTTGWRSLTTCRSSASTTPRSASS